MDSYAIPVIALMALARLVLTWRTRRPFDSWGHLYFVDAVREGRTGPFAPIRPRVAGGGTFHYPFLTHWLLSKLPRRWLEAFPEGVNILLEAIAVASFYMLVRMTGLAEREALIGLLVYSSTPLFFSKVAIGPNVTSFTTRIYSELAATGLVLITAFAGEMVLPGIAAGALLASYIVLSSKFGLQVILFVLLPGGLIFGWPILPASVALGFIMAIAVTRGQFAQTVREQLAHLRWYVRSMRSNRIALAGRNDLSHFAAALHRGNTAKARLTQLLFTLAARNSVTAVLFKAPYILAFPIWAWVDLGMPGTLNPSLGILAVAYVAFVATSCRPLLFLGEAERYPSHFGFLYAALFAAFAVRTGHEWIAWLMIAYGIAFATMELVAFALLQLNRSAHDEDALMLVVRGLPGSPVVLSHPYHILPPFRMMVESGAVPIFPILCGDGGGVEIKRHESYPFVELDAIDWLHDEYGLSLVIVQDSGVSGDLPAAVDGTRWSARRIPGAVLLAHPSLIEELDRVLTGRFLELVAVDKVADREVVSEGSSDA